MRWTMLLAFSVLTATAMLGRDARAEGPYDGFTYHSGCYCVPNAANYGYFPTLWRQWPGEARPEQTFPQALGREPIAAPQPRETLPPPSPKPQSHRLAEPQPSEPEIDEPTPPETDGLRFDDAEPMVPDTHTLPGLEPVLPEGLPGLPDDSSPLPPAEPGGEDPLPPLPGGQLSPFGARGPSLSAPQLMAGQPTRALRMAGRSNTPTSQRSPKEASDSAAPTRRPAKSTGNGKVAEKASFTQPAPLALDGFCPVELGVRERWVQGDPNLLVEYENRTYQVRDEANLRRFLAAPDRYAPAASGNDPVLRTDQGRRVRGRTDYCAHYENRLYMFASPASLKKFQADPKRYAVDP